MPQPHNRYNRLSLTPSPRFAYRFEGYFKEPVHESPTESFRIRNIRVLYYLDDDSMQVSEPKEENSGIPQGVFIKRHRVPKPGSASEVRKQLVAIVCYS